MTIPRRSEAGGALVAAKADGIWSRAWAPVVSFGLHGAALAALIWPLQEPVSNPAPTAMPLIGMAFVVPPAPPQTPAPIAAPAIEPPAPEPVTAAAVDSPSETVADVPPTVESLAADAPVLPAAKPKPKVEQKPVIKTAPKPPVPPEKATARAEPMPAQPMDAIASADTAPAAPQQAAVPVVAPLAVVAPPADYVGLLRQQLERNKVYPRSAQQRRQQGSAMLRIEINRGGQVLSFKIEQSSGFELLDREVVAMVQRASPLPPIPAGLNIDRLEVVVPVEFFLR